MEPLTLYQYAKSGNCYKIRLAASITGQSLNLHDVDLFGGETKTEEYKSKINPNGQVPVLQVGNGTFLPESNAAIFYLADISNSDLIPKDPLERAQMLRWMFFEQYTHEPNVAVRRFLKYFIGDEKLNEAQRARLDPLKEGGDKALGVMENHLANHRFFAANRLTVADIALYAYTHVASDGGFDLSKFPSIQAWLHRVTQHPGYTPM